MPVFKLATWLNVILAGACLEYKAHACIHKLFFILTACINYTIYIRIRSYVLYIMSATADCSVCVHQIHNFCGIKIIYM